MNNEEKYKCVNCGFENKLLNNIWRIGRYKGMKTKSFLCEKCNIENNVSFSVNDKNDLLQILTNPIKKRIK